MIKHHVVLSPNQPASTHLERVMRRMERRGPPILRAIEIGGEWQALEGSHRLAAAAKLGYPIGIEPVELRTRMRADWEPSYRHVEQFLGSIHEWHEQVRYNIEVFFVDRYRRRRQGTRP